MDSQEHENRSSLGHKSLPSWRSNTLLKVLVQSLFQDRTASWVGIVNGVDKYVTESILTKESEDTASGKPVAKANRNADSRLYSCSWKKMDNWKHTDFTIKSVSDVSKDITRLLRTIKRSIEKLTEQSITTTSSKSAGRRRSMVLLHGHLKNGNQLWQQEEELRKGFNVARIQTVPINSCTFEHSKDFQETMLLILRCKTMYYYRKDSPSTTSTSGTRMNWTQ